MTEYKIHTYSKAVDKTLFNLAKNELGNGSRWKEFLLETKPNSDVWKAAAEPYLDGVRVKIPVVSSPVAPSGFDGQLKVIASRGVSIHALPHYTSATLVADVNTINKTYQYKRNNVTRDDTHKRTYVEVSLGGTSTGWLPVSGPSNINDLTSKSEDYVTPHIELASIPVQNTTSVGKTTGSSKSPALEALEMRFVKGEITSKEFSEMKALLA